MEYLSRLSGLAAIPLKSGTAKSEASGSRSLHKKPSLHPVGSVDVFHADWCAVKQELQSPDERALFHGVARSDLPRRLQRIVDALVHESNRSNDGHTGPCMEYLLKYDILTELVELSFEDRPSGIMGETIRTLTNLIILLDEEFLSRRAVHRPISELIQRCLEEDAARFDFDEETAYAADANIRIAEPVYSEDLVDLMCHVASRIRNSPELLHVVFSDELIESAADIIPDLKSLRDGSVILPHNPRASTPDRSHSPTDSIDSAETVQPSRAGQSSDNSLDSDYSEPVGEGRRISRRLRFPLFSYLLKFVHREGKIGELARAGLLFLISLQAPDSRQTTIDRDAPADLSDTRQSLTTFIAHSDFADVLGAGLGAAYGLLPSRIRSGPRYDPTNLTVKMSDDSTLMLGSAPATTSTSDGVVTATLSDDADLQAHLRLLADLLDFCQDVLDSLLTQTKRHDEQKVSSEPDATIVKLAGGIAGALRNTFIKNVVHPSLMESSDLDGSAVAVLSYLDVMLHVLRDRHFLTGVVLDFLLASKNPDDAARMQQYGFETRLDADRYSIKDLILDNMQTSKTTGSQVAALQLARTLLVCHGYRSTGGLLSFARRGSVSDSAPQHSGDLFSTEVGSPQRIGSHLREIDQYAALFAKDSMASLQVSLSTYLVDAEQDLRHNSTFDHGRSLVVPKLRLDSGDPFVQSLFDNMAHFFKQPVEVNVATSGVLSALALNSTHSLKGWLTSSISSADKPGNDTPALLDILRELCTFAQSYRVCIPDFDDYLADRRKGLALADDITEALEADESLDISDTSAEKFKPGTDLVDPDGSANGQRKMKACLSLPRVRAADLTGLQTEESRHQVERLFGIVEDRRSELGSSQDSQMTATALTGLDDESGVSEVRSSGLARLFGGRATRSTPAARTVSGTSTSNNGGLAPRRPSGGSRKVSAFAINPYTDHYRQTTAVLVRARSASAASLWRPPVTSASQQEPAATVTLSSVLDNTILLYEIIKELLAIMQVRRSWGIDPILFT